jgi:hypothetical protein
MTGIDSFILSSLDEVDSILGTVTMTVVGQTFSVVIDDVNKSTSGDDVGLTAEYDVIACAQPADVSNPRLLVNKRCTLDGNEYRINQVRVGTVAIHFILTDINK